MLLPITPVGADDSVSVITGSCRPESVCPPEVGVMVSPLVDVSSDLTADVQRTVSPLPSVEGLLLWTPVVPRSPDVDDRYATPVPRWQLARKGPFLAERSPDSNRSLGLDVPSGKRPIGVRTTLRHRGSSVFPCITRVFSSGSGFLNRPVFSRREQDGGWAFFAGSGYGTRRSIAAGRRSDAD